VANGLKNHRNLLRISVCQPFREVVAGEGNGCPGRARGRMENKELKMENGELRIFL
jgi:hypothetical protein